MTCPFFFNMGQETRRAVITGSVGSSMFLSGCLDGWNLFVDPADRERRQLSEWSFREPLRIQTDYFYSSFRYDLPVEIQYEFEVVVGDRTDVMVMEHEEFLNYRSNRPFDYVTEASEMNSSHGSVTARLSEGRYELVVDNTDRGEASPSNDGNGSITVSIEFASYVV